MVTSRSIRLTEAPCQSVEDLSRRELIVNGTEVFGPQSALVAFDEDVAEPPEDAAAERATGRFIWPSAASLR